VDPGLCNNQLLIPIAQFFGLSGDIGAQSSLSPQPPLSDLASVSMNGGNEVLFADMREGSKMASWILAGSSYEFRLYNSDHTEAPRETHYY
jgi:hypothetical protein